MIETMTPIATKQPPSGNAIALNIGGQRCRIRRYDKLNIVIEQQKNVEKTPLHMVAKSDNPGWKVVAYCGNSPRAIVRSLSEAIISEHTPNGDQLTDQLEALRQAVEDSTAAIMAALTEVQL